MEFLFSYGTLQLEKVQLESFGRLLTGQPDSLAGYKLGVLEIIDTEVLEKSGKQYHPIAVPTGNNEDSISGVIFEITSEELIQADAYEVADYKRIKEEFISGISAWVYVAAK